MSIAPPRRIRGVLLDVDGTLIDSNRAHAESFADAFQAAGFDITADQVEPLVGMGGDKLIPRLTNLEAEQGEGKRIAEAKKERFSTHYLPTLRATRGARQLVERLQGAGLTVIVATSAGGDEVEGLLRQAGVEDLLTETTTSSDAEDSKPDPDIIEAALEKGGMQPTDAVMIGDTPYDIEAAGRAGVACIAVRSGGWSDDALRGALAIFDDPADLVAHFADLPFADSLTGASA
ncbi:MAG: HAD family hydrolase [Gemmatimonadaceae bacterium]|nr:HAD family hydrolase [Gemmatimonadaceae bacterium]